MGATVIDIGWAIGQSESRVKPMIRHRRSKGACCLAATTTTTTTTDRERERDTAVYSSGHTRTHAHTPLAWSTPIHTKSRTIVLLLPYTTTTTTSLSYLS